MQGYQHLVLAAALLLAACSSPPAPSAPPQARAQAIAAGEQVAVTRSSGTGTLTWLGAHYGDIINNVASGTGADSEADGVFKLELPLGPGEHLGEIQLKSVNERAWHTNRTRPGHDPWWLLGVYDGTGTNANPVDLAELEGDVNGIATVYLRTHSGVGGYMQAGNTFNVITLMDDDDEGPTADCTINWSLEGTGADLASAVSNTVGDGNGDGKFKFVTDLGVGESITSFRITSVSSREWRAPQDSTWWILGAYQGGTRLTGSSGAFTTALTGHVDVDLRIHDGLWDNGYIAPGNTFTVKAYQNSTPIREYTLTAAPPPPGLYWQGAIGDAMSSTAYGADTETDGLLKLVLHMPATTTINDIQLTSKSSRVWRSYRNNYWWILGVYNGAGVAQTSTGNEGVISNSATYSGRVELTLKTHGGYGDYGSSGTPFTATTVIGSGGPLVTSCTVE